MTVKDAVLRLVQRLIGDRMPLARAKLLGREAYAEHVAVTKAMARLLLDDLEQAGELTGETLGEWLDVHLDPPSSRRLHARRLAS